MAVRKSKTTSAVKRKAPVRVARKPVAKPASASSASTRRLAVKVKPAGGRAAKPTSVAKRAPVTPPAAPAADKLAVTVDVLDTSGKKSGSVRLPGSLFSARINRQLIAQAVRVYLANQRTGSASTKTRGEVEGSTRKIYRQKGTGRARHGAIRAPIFVGGGITFGPQPKSWHMTMPQTMKHQALASALSEKLQENRLTVVGGMSDLGVKTKHMARALDAVGARGSTLLVTSGASEGVRRAARNIADVDLARAADLSTYVVWSHNRIVFMKEAIGELIV